MSAQDNVNQMNVIVLDEVDSTNSYLLRKDQSGLPHLTVVCAHSQNKGRGRFQREWVSSRGAGLYFSILLRPEDFKNISLLSYCAGLAVIRTLKDIEGISLKWPNDVMVDDKKIAGILLETQTTPGSPSGVVVGIGLNTEAKKEDIPDEATSLFLLGKKCYTNETLLYKIVNEFKQLYQLFERKDFQTIIDEVTVSMSTLNREVRMLLNNEWIEAYVLGVDTQGALQVRSKNGEIFAALPQGVKHLR